MDAKRNRDRAKQLLNHYLMMPMLASGEGWGSDNDVEVDELVNCLIDAAKEEILKQLMRTDKD